MNPGRTQFLSTVTPFVPRRWLTNGHVMTIAVWAGRRAFPQLPAAEPRLFRMTPDTQVLAHCYWQPDPTGRATLVALHGLEGSSRSHYMLGLAEKAWRRGWNAVLLNQRNCGGTEHLTPGLYHSGLTGDARAVVRQLAREGRGPFGIVGYSLGGNLAVKLAGEVEASADPPVEAIVAVSPTIDLDLCVRAIERRANLAYHWNYVRNLKARLRRKAEVWPGLFDLQPLRDIHTIRRFDDVYTAPHFSFAGAGDYYARASALPLASHIQIPTLIVAAVDDPFVPVAQFQDQRVRDNPHISVLATDHGGHCGFAGASATDDGFWAETTAIEFLDSVIAR